MRALEDEGRTFLSGRFGDESGFTQAEDMTIFGPFGGPHRHADPLIRFRPGDESFSLARDAQASN